MGAPARLSRFPSALLDPLALGVLAFALRLGLVLRSAGGMSGDFGYDAGVYYTAASALLHGRLPYGDFLLLHPPGIMLALTPFAVLGRLTTDHTGFIVGNTSFELLGAVNAVLVWRIAGRLGCGRAAALAGGSFYAVWYGCVNAEISARLEPLGSFAFLLGLLLWTGAARGAARRQDVFAGLAFGFAMCVKVWWVVPVLLVLVWTSRAGRPAGRQRLAPLALGAVVAIAAVDGPFFLAAPGAMWRMVILDQLGRHYATPPGQRAREFASTGVAFPGLHGVASVAVLSLLFGLLVLVGVGAWQLSRFRLVVVITGAQLLVLALAPVYFGFYAGYPAGALSLLVAGAAQAGADRRPAMPARVGRPAAVGVLTAVALLTAVATLVRPVGIVSAFPGTRLAAGVTGLRCVMADSPMALIEIDALSRDFANGCPDWVDVTGRTYDVDAPTGPSPHRSVNQPWQADIRRYLLSGDAFLVIRGGTGLSMATRRVLARHRVLERAGRYTVYLSHN